MKKERSKAVRKRQAKLLIELPDHAIENVRRLEKKEMTSLEKEEVDAQAALGLLMERLEQWKIAWPTKFMIPTLGQERFMRLFEKRPFPKDTVLLAGNGFGKTTVGLQWAAGAVWGPRAIPGDESFPGWKGMEDYEVWHVFRERAARERRKISGRIVAAGDSFIGNGAMIQRIQRHFPRGLYRIDKLGKSIPSQIMCWENEDDYGDDSKAIAVIDLKTHKQDIDQFRGPDVDFILFDEPVERDIYLECVGRSRANPDAVRIFTITPLNASGWLISDLVDGADGQKVAVVYGSLWDNCKDFHPLPDFWEGGEVGVGQLLTRGNLERVAIDDQIDKWSRASPDEVEARVWGKPTHLSGSVYKKWNPSLHMVDDIPEDWAEWPIWCLIDPHHARPAAVIWVAQGPWASYVIGEWPNMDYTKINWNVDIPGTCEVIRTHEAGDVCHFDFTDRVTQRWGDPNSLKMVYSLNGGQSLQALFYNEGLWFNPANDDIRYGHECVSNLLHHNHDQPLSETNRPRLFCLRENLVCGGEMVNVPQSMARYRFKEQALEKNTQGKSLRGTLDETYKDFADVIRYFAVAQDLCPFEPVSNQNSLWEKIKQQRTSMPSAPKRKTIFD